MFGVATIFCPVPARVSRSRSGKVVLLDLSCRAEMRYALVTRDAVMCRTLVGASDKHSWNNESSAAKDNAGSVSAESAPLWFVTAFVLEVLSVVVEYGQLAPIAELVELTTAVTYARAALVVEYVTPAPTVTWPGTSLQ